MTRKKDPVAVDNVLVDLEFGDAAELSAKTMLALKLNALIAQRDLSQTAAARVMGMSQPKVSQIRHYKLQNISLERLLRALVAFDQRVEIVVHAAKREGTAGISVAA